jgi:hypothetical protein
MSAGIDRRPPRLRDVQRAVAAFVLSDQADVAPAWIVGDGLAPARRLAVYRNTFASSVAHALRLAFPAVARLVGESFFDHAARSFARAEPPRSAWLDEYGSGFAAFLARFAPAASLAYLADVARLECAVRRALHAPDVAFLDVTRLAGVDAADHERVRFIAHASVALVASEFPVDAIWRAVLAQDDAALAAIDLRAGAVHLLVRRAATGIEVTRIDAHARRFIEALFAGSALGEVLDGARDLDAATLLADYLAAGVFVDFTLTERRTPARAPESSP